MRFLLRSKFMIFSDEPLWYGNGKNYWVNFSAHTICSLRSLVAGFCESSLKNRYSSKLKNSPRNSFSPFIELPVMMMTISKLWSNSMIHNSIMEKLQKLEDLPAYFFAWGF